MTIDFGSDVSVFIDDDLDPLLRVQSGPRVLAEAILRRYDTARGELWYDPEYGYPLRRMLSAALSQRDLLRMRVGVGAEAEKDPRVRRGRVLSFDYTLAKRSLKFALGIDTLAGPFELVISASTLTLDLLGVTRG